jgi:hypothetical protein
MSGKNGAEMKPPPFTRVLLHRVHPDQWVAVHVNLMGEELGRSPGGTLEEAEEHRQNFYRHGAWLLS